MANSHLEAQFKLILRASGLDIEVIEEYRFHPTRRWRADFALFRGGEDLRVLVEIEGGIYTQGRHSRPIGYANDCEKYNAAQLLGYKVLRFTSIHLDNPKYIIKTVKGAIGEN